MSKFMESERLLLISSINPQALQLDIETTLSFYIKEFINNTELSTIDYKVDKIDGRNTTNISPWTSVDMTTSNNDVYSFQYTLSNITASDSISFTFKVVDIDGLEYFKTLNDFNIIA